MKIWQVVTIFWWFCHLVPASSASALLRSREKLRSRRRLNGWNLHPYSESRLSVPGKPEDLQTVSVVVWGATLGTRDDTKVNDGLFCVLRYGPAKTSWEEKLRGTGRVSNTSKPMERSPTWNLGTLVTGSDKTEVSVRVFAMDEPELLLPVLHGKRIEGKRRFLGEFAAGIGTLRQASANSVDGKASFKLSGGGHVQITAIRGGTAPNFALDDFGLMPSMNFEPAAPIAGQQSVRVEDISGAGPLIVGTAPLPLSLQGIWWSVGQSSGSSLLSFGGPNNDGNGCSAGYISGEKNSYRIRAEGDGVITVSDPSGLDKLVEAGDKTYNFEFDSAVNPTSGKVYTTFEGLAAGMKHKLSDQVFNSEIHLLPNGDVEYPGSLIWLRNTSMMSISVRDTKLVQVMDGAGQKIEPAWSKFVAAEKDATDRAYPGWMFYKSMEPVSSPWAVATTEELVQRMQLHVVLIMISLFLLFGGCFSGCGYGCFRLHRTVRQRMADRYEKRYTLTQSYWIN